MRNKKTIIVMAIALCFAMGCEKNMHTKLPEKSPEKVVMTFFQLLADGGKLANREAFGMVSDRNGAISPDNFRRWTENYSKETKLTITKTTLPSGPNGKGEWIAEVEMVVKTPSMFGGDFSTTSTLHLILDQPTLAWKIDFLAETVDEDGYRTQSAEARVEP